MVAFGVALGLMNWSFYGSLAHLPLGVAVTVEFMGPLLLTTVLSRRLLDFVAVGAAAAGVLLISEALTVPFAELSLARAAAGGTAGVFWAAYILLSGRTGAAFPASTAWRSRWWCRRWWCCRPGVPAWRSGRRGTC